jgi:transketolase
MSVNSARIDQLSINTIRTLAMDAVQKAHSGHPGTPMALAPVIYELWTSFLRYDPDQPAWPARDRFILSCGHASMLLYATLHLAQVKQLGNDGLPTGELAVPLEHIKNFRQWESRCPGHPEHGLTTGVETTTGPLGQGIGNSVGMAIAQRWLAANFSKPGFNLWDYNIYAFCSDGDMMEGVGHEAASLAGHLKLANLCWIYDCNHITIEGTTDLAYSDDTARRFQGYGWHVEHVHDANNREELARAYARFLQVNDRPTLIVVHSHIAYGAPNLQDSNKAHGEPLGEEEIRLTKQRYGWPADARFLVPDEVVAHFRETVGKRGHELYTRWQSQYVQYARQHPDLARRWQMMLSGDLPPDWDSELPTFPADAKGTATRNSSSKVLNAVAAKVPWLLGGSADLAPSTKTLISGSGSFEAGEYAGRNFHFGIREHAMAAALNGMALSYLRPYGATFLVFSDYCRAAKRLSAIMELPVIYIYTHDSIGVGEDGPTHQPIEHLAALRAMPRMMVVRPGDANEVTEAWRVIMRQKNRPVSLILTRQDLPTLDRRKYAPAAGLQRGAYVLADAANAKPQVILMATGSEVGLCVAAYEQLVAEGIAARVVSMPCWELFEEQPQAYRDEVLPPGVFARVGVELGVEQGWRKWLGPRGRFLGMNRFGASAPVKVLLEKFGFTPDRVVAEAKAALESR